MYPWMYGCTASRSSVECTGSSTVRVSKFQFEIDRFAHRRQTRSGLGAHVDFLYIAGSHFHPTVAVGINRTQRKQHVYVSPAIAYTIELDGMACPRLVTSAVCNTSILPPPATT